jgi:hypothetical protein
MMLCLHTPIVGRISRNGFTQHNVVPETFCLADTSFEAYMLKPRAPLVIGNLTVSRYIVHGDDVDTAQWMVSSADGKLVRGPFLSQEEAIEVAKDASDSGSPSEKGS